MTEILKLEFKTEREQAEYYFNREFSSIPLDLLEQGQRGSLFKDIQIPSTKILVQEFFDDRGNEKELKKEYRQEKGIKVKDFDEEDFIDWIKENDEFDSWRCDKNWYPMWGTVFGCDEFWVDSEYSNVDKLYELGIGVISNDYGDYLFIAGAGYDFYEEHWIPLFKMIGWIK